MKQRSSYSESSIPEPPFSGGLLAQPLSGAPPLDSTRGLAPNFLMGPLPF